MFISRMVDLCSDTAYMGPHLQTFFYFNYLLHAVLVFAVQHVCAYMLQCKNCTSVSSQQLNPCLSVYLSIEAILLFVATRPTNGIN